jgi:hypothetical protein
MLSGQQGLSTRKVFHMSISSLISQSKTKQSIRQSLFGDREVGKVIRILILTDLIFTIVHGFKFVFKEDFIALFGYWIYRNLTLTNDWAIPEIFNYLKFVVIIYLLFRVFAAIRQPVYLAWAFVYTVALLDDSLQIHEALGEYLGNMIGNTTLFGTEVQGGEQGFRVRDLGELMVYALYGGVFAIVLGFGFLWSDSLHRIIGIGFVVLLGALAFFAAVVDLLARFVSVFGVVGTIEDAGEMLVISLTVGYALIIYRRYGPSSPGPMS